MGCTQPKSSGNTNDIAANLMSQIKGINREVFSWMIGGLTKDQENPALPVEDKMWLGLGFTTVYLLFSIQIDSDSF